MPTAMPMMMERGGYPGIIITSRVAVGEIVVSVVNVFVVDSVVVKTVVV